MASRVGLEGNESRTVTPRSPQRGAAGAELDPMRHPVRTRARKQNRPVQTQFAQTATDNTEHRRDSASTVALQHDLEEDGGLLGWQILNVSLTVNDPSRSDL